MIPYFITVSCTVRIINIRRETVCVFLLLRWRETIMMMMMIRRRRRITCVLHHHHLLLLVCLPTFCVLCGTVTLHVALTIIMLATKVTFYSSIFLIKKSEIVIAMWRFVLQVLPHCMDDNKNCTLYSTLTLVMATNCVIQTRWDDTVGGVSARWTRLSVSVHWWLGKSNANDIGAIDPVLQSRWDRTAVTRGKVGYAVISSG